MVKVREKEYLGMGVSAPFLDRQQRRIHMHTMQHQIVNSSNNFFLGTCSRTKAQWQVYVLPTSKMAGNPGYPKHLTTW